jgi:GTP pyrophosphokinase
MLHDMTIVKPVKDILAELVQKDEESQALVTLAYSFAEHAHRDQKRYSGEPYFLHSAQVGYSLAQIGMDAATVAAGLLHDTIEDVGTTEAEVQEKFGEEVLSLVDGVTKLGKLRYRGMERHTESLRKLFAATAKDIRVLIIKLLDRLHNAQTLEHVPAHKRKRIAMETLEIYAPIADRLGMGIIKKELEDAAFPYAYPREYEKVRELLKERKSENEKRLEKAERVIKRELAQAGILSFHTEARVKGVYSLFRKLERKDWDITKIHDILALRLLVPSVADCYTVLGIVHSQWRPVPGKIKDYIAFPKPNGYQSIHTTIYTGDGGTLEIQVRTDNMNREAKFGIASHFSYKEATGYDSSSQGSGMAWVRQFIPKGNGKKVAAPKSNVQRIISTQNAPSVPTWVHDLATAQEASAAGVEMDAIKLDFFSHRVFVFTPKGDVIDLPMNATPIDFAYSVHSEIGNHMAGAKVNGKMVSLETELHNGDIVEIITRDKSKPSRKWYDMAKTTVAKKHIRAALGEAKE